MYMVVDGQLWRWLFEYAALNLFGGGKGNLYLKAHEGQVHVDLAA